jgi:hypothetical protein
MGEVHQLTQGLSKAWYLGDLLDKSLSGTHNDDPLVELIGMEQILARASKMAGIVTKQSKRLRQLQKS